MRKRGFPLSETPWKKAPICFVCDLKFYRREALREAEGEKGTVEEDLKLLAHQEMTKRTVYEGLYEAAEEKAL